MDYDSLLELVKSRRSIRQFKTEPIPDEYIDKIIEVARWAPSGANIQPWEFVIIKKQELKNRIVDLIMEARAMYSRVEATRESWMRPAPSSPTGVTYTGFEKAPVFILVLSDPRVRAGLPIFVRYNNEDWRSVYKSSMAMAYVYMHLAATALGLGSQWVSQTVFTQVQCLIKELLGIPMDMEIYDMMALGYPDMVPKPRVVRNREEMVHYDYCGAEAFRTDEAVKEFLIQNRSRH